MEPERADGEDSKLVRLESGSASLDCWCGLVGLSCGCMREGSGGWRIIPGKDPTSARISGTVETEEKKIEVLQLVLHIRLVNSETINLS